MELEQKQTQCGQQAAALNETLSTLEKIASVLGEKLQPVRSPRPCAVGEKRVDSVSQVISPLAQYMKELNEQAQRIATQLATLVEEVEC